MVLSSDIVHMLEKYNTLIRLNRPIIFVLIFFSVLLSFLLFLLCIQIFPLNFSISTSFYLCLTVLAYPSVFFLSLSNSSISLLVSFLPLSSLLLLLFPSLSLPIHLVFLSLPFVLNLPVSVHRQIPRARFFSPSSPFMNQGWRNVA